MTKTTTIFLFGIILLLCTIESNFRITFLISGLILLGGVVKILSFSHPIEPPIKGNPKQHTFSSKTPMFLAIFIVLTLFFRLGIYQNGLFTDYYTLGCRQTGQEIDIHIHGSIVQKNHSKVLLFSTPQGTFSIQSFLSSDQKELITQYTSFTISGVATCFGPGRISPFTKEAMYVSRGYRGVITKISTLTPDASSIKEQNPLSPSFSSQLTSQNTKTSGILRGILLGDTSLMTPDTYQLFLDSGLVHLVSASGGNIAILLQIATTLFFFLSLKHRKILFALIVVLYTYLVGENISFSRAVTSFFIVMFFIPHGYYRSPKNIYIAVLCILLFVNPLYSISSRGLLLSACGVWGLIHIPHQFNKNKYLSSIIVPLYANVALIGPLFLLIHHINILTFPLSIIASIATTGIIILSPLTLIPQLSFISQYSINILYNLASFGSTYGVFISTPTTSNFIALIVRIISRLFIYFSYTYLHKKHLTSLRD